MWHNIKCAFFMSNRDNHHLVDRARNQNTTEQRRRPFNSRRTRKKIRRPLGGGGPPARANIATNKHHHRRTKSKRRSHSVHEPQKEPLSFRKSSFSYVYLSAAAILCDHFLSLVKNFQTKTKIFEVSRFSLLLLCFQNSKISGRDRNRIHSMAAADK